MGFKSSLLFYLDEVFPFKASVEYLLKKRYLNLKQRKNGGKVPPKEKVNLATQHAKQDDASLHKELMKELGSEKNKNKEVNWEVVKKLQKLSFPSRRDAIQEVAGVNAVSTILEKYPFLDNEQMASPNYVLLIHDNLI